MYSLLLRNGTCTMKLKEFKPCTCTVSSRYTVLLNCGSDCEFFYRYLYSTVCTVQVTVKIQKKSKGRIFKNWCAQQRFQKRRTLLKNIACAKKEIGAYNSVFKRRKTFFKSITYAPK